MTDAIYLPGAATLPGIPPALVEPPAREWPRGRVIAMQGLLIALCLALGAGVSYSHGQDINYDQLNYHYYTAFAYRTHRLTQDVAPSQRVHSFLSPIVYVPFYVMVRTLPPYLVGILLGAVHGLNLWLAGMIGWVVTRGLGLAVRIATLAAAVVISGASPMAISELGTSMADIVTSLLVLAGLALLMRVDFEADRVMPAYLRIAIAGALVGAAVSLKLTNAIFAFALAAAALCDGRNWRNRLAALLSVGIGGVAGFVAIGGAWYLRMWRMFHNPVFPYFNGIFHSPDFPEATSFFDARFIPHGLLDALSYPFRWARAQHLTAEVPFRDIRFALLLVLGAIALILWLARRAPRTAEPARVPAGGRLIVFIAVAFCLWMYVWSIQRYIVALEFLTGPAIVVMLRWCGLRRIVRGGAALAGAAGTIAIACAVTVKIPDWGHLGWRSAWYQVNIPPAASDHPIYFLADDPLAYLVPELQPGAAVIGYTPGDRSPVPADTVFGRRIRSLLADPNDDAVRVIALKPPGESFRRSIAQFGLQVDNPCHTIPGRPGPLTWCTLSRVVPHE